MSDATEWLGSFICCLCVVMALSTNYHLPLSFAVLAIFFSLTLLLPTKSGGMNHTASSMNMDEQVKKKILGSRPPACGVDKCMNCRPCEATLVIPPHRNSENKDKNIQRAYEKSARREDDSYYLLSWKCRCGDKFYQPGNS